MKSSSSVDAWVKLVALRTVLHLFTLSPVQSAQLVRILPPPKEGEISLRVDAFVALYSRCTDIGGLLSTSSHGLYGLEILTREEVLNVRVRLGRFRTWDITRCEAEQLVPGDRAGNINTRKAEAEKDRQEIQKTLAELKLAD